MTALLARAKALVPLALYGISEALKHGFDLHTPTGIQAFVSAAIVAILVHTVPNKTA